MDVSEHSARAFTINIIQLMGLTAPPLGFIAIGQYEVIAIPVLVICYALIFSSQLTRHLLSTEPWMKQMLFYVVPAVYAADAVLAVFSETAARICAVIGVFIITALWRRCGIDYTKAHFKATEG